MSISEKQLEANRENAKKGGVNTEQGKSISRLNAEKHGIFTKVMIAEAEEGEILDQLIGRLFDEFTPKGILEETLVDRIVIFIWRLRRCAIAEKAIIEQDLKSEGNKNMAIIRSPRFINSKKMVLYPNNFEVLLRFETTIERQLYRVTRELREIQKMRFITEQKALIPGASSN